MKVSRHWLSKFFDTALPPAEALAEALTLHAFEIEGVERVGDPRQGEEAPDEILDVKVTPNRGHDCLSHRGIATELSAILNLALTSDPLVQAPNLKPTTKMVEVTIHEPDLCPRYIAGYVQGVKVGPSPSWLRERLEAVGQRSINNVVDATNFVMFNLGQPLHAFDAGKLSPKAGVYKIGVRKARVNEEIEALDGKKYTLGYQNLVITDEDILKPIGIAGVKGGLPAAITEATQDIIIESANFNGPCVRKSAQGLKLRTDASSRFEQGLSPELAAYGARAAVDLILKLAGGTLAGFVDQYPSPQRLESVSVSLAHMRRVLGASIGDADVRGAFGRLGFEYTVQKGSYTVVPPWVRLDLNLPEDLIEEVARIVGYERIPATPLPPLGLASGKPPLNENFYRAEAAREDLRTKGYSEVYTSVFAEEGERAVANKIGGDRPYLRASLLPGLKEALAKNIPNKDLLGLKEIKLFEIGSVWRGGQEEMMLGTVGEGKEAGEVPLASVHQKVDAWSTYPAWLPPPAQYKPFSRYPYIVRDVAAWVPKDTDENKLREAIQAAAGDLCSNVRLFDRFEKPASTQGGEGKVSFAYRLIFQSFDKTLTELEANSAMDTVHAALRAEGYEIR